MLQPPTNKLDVISYFAVLQVMCWEKRGDICFAQCFFSEKKHEDYVENSLQALVLIKSSVKTACKGTAKLLPADSFGVASGSICLARAVVLETQWRCAGHKQNVLSFQC